MQKTLTAAFKYLETRSASALANTLPGHLMFPLSLWSSLGAWEKSPSTFFFVHHRRPDLVTYSSQNVNPKSGVLISAAVDCSRYQSASAYSHPSPTDDYECKSSLKLPISMIIISANLNIRCLIASGLKIESFQFNFKHEFYCKKQFNRFYLSVSSEINKKCEFFSTFLKVKSFEFNFKHEFYCKNKTFNL